MRPAGAAASSPPRRDTAVAITLAAADADALAWRDRALCAEVDPEMFFPEKGGSVREPKRVCRACDVRAECLEYALEHEERFGIWGGMSERERRRIKQRRLAASSASQPGRAA